jgi:glycosyltransferase involved in cell wall biosynthesis/intein/homing endonuclease
MMNERILVFGDSFQNPTGFGVNSKRICWALAKKYDVHHIGIQYYGKKKPVEIEIEGEKRTVTIHPNLPKANVPDGVPDIGYKSIPYLIDGLEPDVFLSINDIHMCSHVSQSLYPKNIKLQVMNLPAKEMKSDFEIQQQLNGLLQKYKEKYLRKTKWVGYCPQDSLPPMKKWEYTYKIMDKVIAYTKFGQKVFKDYFNMDVPYIYHGVDSEVFKPLDTRPDNVKDKFIVGDMNRNQVRKQPIQLIKGFAKFAKGKDDVLLHLQKDWNDLPGYKLEYFVKIYGLQDKLIKPFPRGVNQFIIRNIYNSWDVNMNSSAGEGFGLCLRSSVDILTKKDSKSIKDVTVDDFVMSRDGKFHRVVATTKRKIDSYYKVNITKSRGVECSEEHPFLVTKQTRHQLKGTNGYRKQSLKLVWNNVKNLKPGDFVVTPIPKHKNINRIIDLSKYDSNIMVDNDKIYYKFGYSPNKKWSYDKISKETGYNKSNKSNAQSDVAMFMLSNNMQLPKQKYYNRYITVDDDLLYVLGWYIAEGSCSDSMIDFSLNINEYDIAKKIKSILENKFNCNANIRFKEHKNTCIVTASGKILSKFFRKECGHLAQNKHIPYWIMPDRKKSLKIVRATIDGDGHISYKNHTIAHTTVSKTLAWQLWETLLANKIISNVKERKQSDGFDNCNLIYNIFITGQSFYNYMNIKPKKRTGSHCIIKDEYLLSPVVSIDKINENTMVYDIQVEDTHNFVGNGVLVHNTQIEAGACGKPSISTDYTAMTEIIKGGDYSPRGQLVDKTLYWRQLQNAAGQQAIPDHNQIAKALQKYYDNRKLMKRHGNNMRKWVNKYCTMKKLQHDWTKTIDELLSE